MSSNSIREEVSLKLLQDVERAERNIVSEAARKVLSTKEASQCLVLDRKAVSALVLGMEAGIGRKFTTYERKKYRAEVKEHFITISKPFPDIPGKAYFVNILAQNRLSLGRNIFFLGTDFAGIKKKYHEFNEDFITRTKTLQNTKYDRKKPGSEVQFDHGAEGTAVGSLGGGSAAVAVALDRGVDFAKLQKVAGDNLAAIIDSQFNGLSKSAKSKVYTRLFDIIVNWDQVVTESGGLNAGVGVIIRPVKTKQNLGRSDLEKKEMNALLDAIDATVQGIDWTEVRGSSNAREKAQKAAVDRIVKPLKKVVKDNPGSSIEIDKELKQIQLKTSAKVKTQSKKSSSVKAKAPRKNRGKLAGPIVAKSGGRRKPRESNFKTLQLIGLLNAALPKVVAKNMGSPRLNYRTGRFAGSVRVTDIALTAKGHPSIGYTYQTNPYQVFEASSGSRFSSVERDPRRLIDLSIREIAAQQAIGRLFTRRV